MAGREGGMKTEERAKVGREGRERQRGVETKEEERAKQRERGGKKLYYGGGGQGGREKKGGMAPWLQPFPSSALAGPGS